MNVQNAKRWYNGNPRRMLEIQALQLELDTWWYNSTLRLGSMRTLCLKCWWLFERVFGPRLGKQRVQALCLDCFLYAGLVLRPDLSALCLVLLRLVLGVLEALRRRGGDGRLEVALEPGVEAGVVLALERGALVGQAGGHGVCSQASVWMRGQQSAG